MPLLVFAGQPATPAGEIARLNPTIEMTWRSWDGTTWDLTTGKQGVALQQGIRGLNMPKITRYSQASAGVHGSRRTGWVAQDREVYWPTLIYRPPGDPTWAELDTAFWRSMHPERPGVWSVKSPLLEAPEIRTLSCTYADDNGHSMGPLPSIRGWERYGIYLTADKPFWMGEPVRHSWGPGAPASFFGPVLTISSGSSMGSAVINNPGDLEAWPKWTLVGPVSSASLGLNGRQIRAPFAIPAGKALQIDTDPTVQTILYGDWTVGSNNVGRFSNGKDRFIDMAEIDFTPVPAGKNVPLQITTQEPGDGAGVLLELTPRYFRAW